MQNNHHPKITPVHLDRKEIIYIRQSSEKQVQEHLESRRLQYALRGNRLERVKKLVI